MCTHLKSCAACASLDVRPLIPIPAHGGAFWHLNNGDHRAYAPVATARAFGSLLVWAYTRFTYYVGYAQLDGDSTPGNSRLFWILEAGLRFPGNAKSLARVGDYTAPLAKSYLVFLSSSFLPPAAECANTHSNRIRRRSDHDLPSSPAGGICPIYLSRVSGGLFSRFLIHHRVMSWTEDSWVANGLLLVRSHQLMSLAFLVGTYIVRVAI